MINSWFNNPRNEFGLKIAYSNQYGHTSQPSVVIVTII